MTQEQRRELIREQLTETPEKSDRQIAAGLGVSNSTVSVARKELVEANQLCESHSSIGADGKERPRQVFRKPVTIFNPTPAEEKAIQNPAVIERMAVDEIPATAAIREIKRQEIIAKLEDIGRLLDGSAEYQAIQQRIRDDANRARSEAANQRRGEDGRLQEKPVAPQCEVQLVRQRSTPGADAKAALLEVSRPAVERAAFIQAKAPEIAATVLPLDGLKAELAEIDENLVRNELHFTERGEHFARRKKIYEALHPETKAGQYGHKGGKVVESAETAVSSFASDTASKTGVSSRVIHEEIQLARDLVPEAKEAIRAAGITKTEALKLSGWNWWLLPILAIFYSSSGSMPSELARA